LSAKSKSPDLLKKRLEAATYERCVIVCARSAAKRAEACQSAFGRLSRSIAALGHLGVGAAEGSVLCSFASAGHLDTQPLGNVVNAAFREANKNAS
jgi:hypothetical protein